MENINPHIQEMDTTYVTFLGDLAFILVSVMGLPLPIELISGVIFMGGGAFVFLFSERVENGCRYRAEFGRGLTYAAMQK